MGRWQQRIQKGPRPELTELTEPTKPDCVSFVSTSQKHFENSLNQDCPKPEPTKPRFVSSVSKGHRHFEKYDDETDALSNACRQIAITPEEVRRGLRLWQSPFCRTDLEDLESGALPLWQARDYLALWIKENPETMARLKSDHNPEQERDDFAPLSLPK